MDYSTRISERMWNLPDKGELESKREQTFIDDIVQKNHIERELLEHLDGVHTVFDGGAGCGRFSILLARYKGFLAEAAAGAAAIDRLGDGDTVLMAEGCTHHRQCNDIGTVKIPRWLRAHTGADLVIETCTGRDFPEDLSPYRLVIHCGGCMLTETVVQYRMNLALAQGVPFTNYGIAIARMTGTLERSLRLFPQIHALLAEGGR